MNTDTPANAAESDAGRYGKATIRPNAIEQQPRDLVGRIGPLGREIPEDDLSFFDLAEEQLHEADRAADDQGDEDDEQEVRQVAEEGLGDGARRRHHVAQQRVGDGARPREQPEDVGQVQIERQQQQEQAEQPKGAIDGVADSIRRHDLRILHAYRAEARGTPAFGALAEPPRRSHDHPHQDRKYERRAQPVETGADQGAGRAPETLVADRLLELLRDKLRQRGARGAETQGVPGGHDHQQPWTDAHFGRSFNLDDGDGRIGQRSIRDRLFETRGDPPWRGPRECTGRLPSESR